MRILGLLLAVLAFAPATAAAAEPAYETIRVPTVGGESLHVEIARPATNEPVPVILTYSPYNSLSEGTLPNLANDALAARYLEQGYARAVADVLGTRNSTGCWDYGGPLEQQSGVDLVNALAAQPWANGKVAMIGGSYDGTTANMVAARGDDAPGLAAIVPELAISRWYGYAYQDGVRYFLNSQRPTDEGFDTPLAFDFGISRTPPTDPTAYEALQDRVMPCDAAEHTERGYDTSPDYDEFWRERDYRKDAASFRAAALIVHGWQDYNVKQSEGVDLFTALPDDHLKLLYMFQGGHQSPSGAQYQPLLDDFFAQTLKGEARGLESRAPVITQGRSAAGNGEFRSEQSWPPAGTEDLRLALGRELGGGVLRAGRADRALAGYVDTGTGTEEVALKALRSEQGWLAYESEPLARGLRIAGTPRLELEVTLSADHGHVTPTLVDLAPDGTAKPISRGFLNLRYRQGLGGESPVPVGEPVRADVTFSPQDHTVSAGHRVALVVQSSNAVWAVPDQPAGTAFTVHHGGRRGSALVLPVSP